MGDQPAVDPEALLGEPVEHVGGRRRLAAGLGERLALLEGHKAGDVVRPLADQLGCPSHDRAALRGGLVTPYLEPALGGVEGAVEILDRGVCHRTDHLPRRGVVDRDRAPVGCVDPGVVDEEQSVRVGHGSVPMSVDDVQRDEAHGIMAYPARRPA